MMTQDELKPRPHVGKVRAEMETVRNDLVAIIAARKDKDGTLDDRQLEKARKTKDALDAALRDVDCVQLLAPY